MGCARARQKVSIVFWKTRRPTSSDFRKYAPSRRNSMIRRGRRAAGTPVSLRVNARATAASALYSRIAPDRVESSLADGRFDSEGRLLIACFGRMTVVTAYFPKGSGKERDNSRVPYKLDFYSALFDRIQQLKRRGPVYVIGDYNTAHEAIDLARPKTNDKTSGFLPEERAEFGALDRGGVGGYVSRETSRRRGPLHVVAAVGRCARKQRRLADRLRPCIRIRRQARTRCVHLARRARFGPLSRWYRYRLIGVRVRAKGHKSAEDLEPRPPNGESGH